MNLLELIDVSKDQDDFVAALGFSRAAITTKEQQNALYIAWRLHREENIEVGHA